MTWRKSRLPNTLGLAVVPIMLGFYNCVREFNSVLSFLNKEGPT